MTITILRDGKVDVAALNRCSVVACPHPVLTLGKAQDDDSEEFCVCNDHYFSVSERDRRKMVDCWVFRNRSEIAREVLRTGFPSLGDLSPRA